jgi:hypothetical protein
MENCELLFGILKIEPEKLTKKSHFLRSKIATFNVKKFTF